MNLSTTIFFLAPLSNFESEDLDLGNGFKIENMRLDLAADRISVLEGISKEDAYKKLIIEYSCVQGSSGLADKQTATFICKSFEIDQEINDTHGDEWQKLIDPAMQKHFEYTKSLKDIIDKMRLFKEGAIRTPVYHSFFMNGSKINSLGTAYGIVPGGYKEGHLMEKYVLTHDEIAELNTFFSTIELPFSQPYIDLCFNNFSLSYNIDNNALSFLSLMMSLEVLFNQGKTDISYTIARCSAALLSKDKTEFSSNFKAMKAFYNKRSKCVHEGKVRDITSEDVLQLRGYVRRAIIKAGKINKSKKDLIDLLNSVGFEILQ